MNTYEVDVYVNWLQHLPLLIEANNEEEARHIVLQLIQNMERPAPKLRKGKVEIERIQDEQEARAGI